MTFICMALLIVVAFLAVACTIQTIRLEHLRDENETYRCLSVCREVGKQTMPTVVLPPYTLTPEQVESFKAEFLRLHERGDAA